MCIPDFQMKKSKILKPQNNLIILNEYGSVGSPCGKKGKQTNKKIWKKSEASHKENTHIPDSHWQALFPE